MVSCVYPSTEETRDKSVGKLLLFTLSCLKTTEVTLSLSGLAVVLGGPQVSYRQVCSAFY